jgi:protein TonB
MKMRGFAVLAAVLVSTGAGQARANDWSTKVAGLIAAQHSYPRSAQIRGEEGTAKIRISIDATGKISNVELLEKTGSDILDREAVRIPTKLGQVPPPPNAKPAALIVPIAWKLS